jgi:tetratricopeptide (TPR) repeat protein
VPITPPPPFHSLPVAEESRSAEQPNSEILTCDTSTDMNSWQDELDLKKSDELSAQVVSETDEAIYLAQRVMSPPVPLAEISEVDGESEISQTSESDETLSRAIPYISSDDPAQQAQAIFEQYDFSSAEAIASPIQDGSFESLEHSVPDRLDYEPPIVQEQLSTDSSSAEEISLEDEDIDEIEYFTDSTILDAFDESSTFANELEEALLYFEQEEYIYSLQIYREILARDPHHQIALQGERESLSAIEQKRIREEQERSSLDLDLDAALGSITPLSGTARRRATQDIQAFTDAVKSTIGEEEGDAHFDLGIAYQGMGLLSQAIDAFQLCLRNQYRPLDSYKMLGSCYCMQGNLEQALSSYQRALSLPDITHEQHLDILFDIGLAYEQYNQISQALKYYQEVALLEHNYREVQQKIQYLHSL